MRLTKPSCCWCCVCTQEHFYLPLSGVDVDITLDQMPSSRGDAYPPAGPVVDHTTTTASSTAQLPAAPQHFEGVQPAAAPAAAGAGATSSSVIPGVHHVAAPTSPLGPAGSSAARMYQGMPGPAAAGQQVEVLGVGGPLGGGMQQPSGGIVLQDTAAAEPAGPVGAEWGAGAEASTQAGLKHKTKHRRRAEAAAGVVQPAAASGYVPGPLEAGGDNLWGNSQGYAQRPYRT